MKKLFSVLCVLCLLTGCASTGALNQTNAKLDENVKRIDQNFVIVKNVLDAQAKAIKELQAKNPEPAEEKVNGTDPIDEVRKNVDEGKVFTKK